MQCYTRFHALLGSTGGAGADLVPPMSTLEGFPSAAASSLLRAPITPGSSFIEHQKLASQLALLQPHHHYHDHDISYCNKADGYCAQHGREERAPEELSTTSCFLRVRVYKNTEPTSCFLRVRVVKNTDVRCDGKGDAIFMHHLYLPFVFSKDLLSIPCDFR